MPLITLPEDELSRLAGRIRDGWANAKGAHSTRMQRFQSAYRRYRNMLDEVVVGEEERSNVRVPLIQWQVLAELARESGSLFGDDAEIVAKATGPSDQKTVAKVARFVDWRVFHSMKLVNPFIEFIFRKIVFGRSHALVPWKRDTYTVLGQDGARQEALWYEGPDFIPLWPDELIVPPENARTIHDFSWVIVRSRKTWDELVRGEKRGLYSEVTKNLDSIKGWGHNAGERAAQGDEIRAEADEAEGVEYQAGYATRGSLEVWSWYGYSEPNDKGEREEWVVTYLPDLQLVIGIQDLVEIYPQSKHRRPIVESSMTPTGEYWSMGFAELLDVWEDELTANENLFTDAAQFAVGPLIIAKPALGAQLRRAKYEPFMIIDSEDPASAQVIRVEADAQAYTLKQQSTLAMAERITGLTDQSMGRALDRPNAPRTAAGQLSLIQQGDIRVSFNMLTLREDMARVLEHIWELECQFASESVFFRVTEEDAGGLFDVKDGGTMMDRRDFAGRYDFDIQFATSALDKAARKQDALTLFTSATQNPLIVQNPKALWAVTDQLYRAFGNDRFSDIIPQPPDPGLPKSPREEWTLMLQGEGEDLNVNPLDDDDAHMIDHGRRLDQAAESVARGELVDREAIRQMIGHVLDHQAQKKQKMQLQALTQQLQQQVVAMGAPGAAASDGVPGMGGMPGTVEEGAPGAGMIPQGGLQ